MAHVTHVTHPAPWARTLARLRPRAALTGALCAAALLLGACATPPPPDASAALLRDAAYAAPEPPPPEAGTLFALSPAMQAFLAAESRALEPPRDPRRALVQALYRSREPGAAGAPGLRLAYDATRTLTASEAYEAGAGNCLSLVLMTAAFARQLDIGVSYQAVSVDETYSRSGTLTLASGHVNLVLSPRANRGLIARADPDLLVVDFLAPHEIRQQRSHPLREATIVAMYYNNRAAELLADNRTDAAYWHAREALRHDAGFLPAANTLGVIHQRAGLADAAEQAFRHVLAQDPRALAALSNLVALLRQQGRAEAEALAARLAELQPLPPLHWLQAGRRALAAGDASGALALLQRELRRQPDQDEVHAALAEAHLRLGDLARAEHHLALAARLSPRRADQHRYETKLGHLRRASPPPTH